MYYFTMPSHTPGRAHATPPSLPRLRTHIARRAGARVAALQGSAICTSGSICLDAVCAQPDVVVGTDMCDIGLVQGILDYVTVIFLTLTVVGMYIYMVRLRRCCIPVRTAALLHDHLGGVAPSGKGSSALSQPCCRRLRTQLQLRPVLVRAVAAVSSSGRMRPCLRRCRWTHAPAQRQRQRLQQRLR
jgi:hypothetical protein